MNGAYVGTMIASTSFCLDLDLDFHMSKECNLLRNRESN